MSTSGFTRKRLLVDRLVQGALLGRVVLYWFSCLVMIGLMLVCWNLMTGPARPFYRQLDEVWFQNGPALVASLFLLPMILMDVLRFSNRFAGPMVRVRRALDALAQGEPIEPLRFRDADFWHDVAEQINKVAERVKQLENAPAAQSKPQQAREEPVGVGA